MTDTLVDSIDHVMIACADADTARTRWEHLGFRVDAGGRHDGLGTANSVIACDGGFYVELLAVVDPAATRDSLPGGDEFIHHVKRDAEVPTTFVLSSSRLDEIAQNLRTVGVKTAGPIDMERLDGHGGLVQWQLLIPEGTPWRREIPVFVHWRAGAHPAADGAHHSNGVAQLTRLTATARDLDFAYRLYHDVLGLPCRWDAGRQTADRQTLEVQIGARSLLLFPDGTPTGASSDAAREPGVTELVFAAGPGVPDAAWPSVGPAAVDRPFATVVARG